MLNKFNKIKSVLLCAAFVAIAACSGGSSEPKLDASTDQALLESTKKVTASLSEDKQKEFAEAMVIITATSMMELVAAGSPPDEKAAKEVEEKLRAKLNGKTAEQIIVMGKELKASATK